MKECLLAGPGRPLAPCRPPHLPPPAFGRHCPGPWQILAIRVSSPSAVVHAGRGEGGLRRPAGLHVRAHTCVHRSCLLSGYPPARAHACVHSFMHERMVYSRKACRVGLPLSFVGGLANGDVDFRLTLDQISGAARCSRQGTAITTVFEPRPCRR
jgi:hypothetical protein